MQAQHAHLVCPALLHEVLQLQQHCLLPTAISHADSTGEPAANRSDTAWPTAAGAGAAAAVCASPTATTAAVKGGSGLVQGLQAQARDTCQVIHALQGDTAGVPGSARVPRQLCVDGGMRPTRAVECVGVSSLRAQAAPHVLVLLDVS